MALTNMDKRRPSLVSKEGELKNGWEKERRRGRGRGEEEKRRGNQGQKGTETELKYGVVWIYGILRLCMVNSLSPKVRVLIELHPNLRFLEIKVGKTHKEQDKYGIPLLGWIHG